MSSLSIRPLTDEEYKRERNYACISIDCREQFAKRHKLEFIPKSP